MTKNIPAIFIYYISYFLRSLFIFELESFKWSLESTPQIDLYRSDFHVLFLSFLTIMTSVKRLKTNERKLVNFLDICWNKAHHSVEN